MPCCALPFSRKLSRSLLVARIKDSIAPSPWHLTQTQERDVPGIAKISASGRTNLASNSWLTQAEGCTAIVEWYAFNAMLARPAPEVTCEDGQMLQDVEQCA